MKAPARTWEDPNAAWDERPTPSTPEYEKFLSETFIQWEQEAKS